MFLLVSAVVQAVSALADVPANVMNGFYPGRSGDAVVQSLNAQEGEGLALFVDPSQRYFRKLGSSGSQASSQDLGDVMTRSLGIQPLNGESGSSDFASDLVHSNLLDMPKANLFISLEGMEAQMVDELHLSNLQTLSRTSSASLRFPSYPQDSISEAASISTGKLPKEHGVVGSTWEQDGASVSAFLEATAFSNTATAADLLAQTFQGQSLIVSASSDAQQSLAYCSNFELLKAHAEWNTFCLALNPSTLDYQCVEPTHSYSKLVAEKNLVLSKETLMQALNSDDSTVLSSLSSSQSISARVNGQVVSVDSPVGSASFDLSDPEDYKFFSELQYAYSMPAVVGQDPVLQALVMDDVPDYYALSFASLSTLGAKYGTTSAKFATAATLVDACLPSIMGRFQALYPDRLVSEVVLPASASSHSAAAGTSAAIEASATLLQSSASAVSKHFPQLTVSDSSLCSHLSQGLKQVGYTAYCPQQQQQGSVGQIQALSLDAYDLDGPEYPYPGNNSNPNSEEIMVFQISLWVSLGLIFSTTAATCCLCNMEYKKDPLIYGNFNPDWSSRKRR